MVNKNILKLLTFLLILSFNSSAGLTQTIEMRNTLGYVRFFQNGKKYNYNQTINLMESNPEAHNLMKSANNLGFFIFLFRTLGNSFITVAIIRAAQSKDGAKGAAVWGGATLLLSLPFSIIIHSKMKKAVNIYNQGISTGSNYQQSPQFILFSNNDGIGIGLKF